jgi:hypothetical protein
MPIEKPKPDMVFNVWDDGWGRRGMTKTGRPHYEVRKAREANDAFREMGMMFVPYRIRVYLKTKKAA